MSDPNANTAPPADTASVLFGDTTPQGSTPAPEKPGTVIGAPDKPTNPPAGESTAEVLFEPEVQYREALREDLNTLGDLGYGKDELDAHAHGMAEAFTDAGIAVPAARDLHGLIVTTLKSPVGDEVVEFWAAESRTMLRERYGEEHEERLQRAMAFVTARPSLRNMLVVTGLGSHPRFVAALAERAHQLRAPRTKP